MDGLKGKTAVVTGGGTGIGQAAAIALAREGVKIVVCGRRKEPLEKTVDAIRLAKGRALAVQADASNAEDVTRVVNAAINAFGTIDILINNAAIDGGDAIHQHDIDKWDRVMAVNLRGPFLFARAVLPVMRFQRRGDIVNISSEAGIEYYAGTGAYTIAKHGLNALSELIQSENQDHNIRVNTVCPGMVVTDMTQDEPGLHHDKCLYPEDIADLIVWLVSRRSNVKIGRPILIQTMLNPWE